MQQSKNGSEVTETEYLGKDRYTDDYKRECKKSISDIYDRIVNIWVNILLNIYIKNKTNDVNQSSSSTKHLKGKRRLNVLQSAK